MGLFRVLRGDYPDQTFARIYCRWNPPVSCPSGSITGPFDIVHFYK
jgi:hypothetical protein